MPNINVSTINWAYILELLIVPGCILFIALTIGITLNRFINQRINRHLDTDETNLQNVFIHALKGVPIFFCMVAGLYWIVNSIDIPPSFSRFFSYVLFTINIYTITRVLSRTGSGMIDLYMTRNDSRLPKTTLLNNLLSIIIYIMGILVILQYWGISITPIITAMGVGGMAVALGMQETLANIFAGLQLIITKQLRLDDFIMLSNGQQGRVTDITWRFTTIQSTLGNLIIIPNKNISSTIITNYNLPNKDITIKIPVGVAYDSDLEFVEKITLEVANKVMQDEHDTSALPPKVLFHDFGDSAIEFDVVIHSSRFETQNELKHNFIKALTKRYREENIEIPYPVRTILQETGK